MKREPRVEVHWIDSGLNDSNGWKSKNDIKNQVSLDTVVTTGFLIHEDSDSYIVAHSRTSRTDLYYGIQAIQKTNVKKFKRLRWQSN